MNKISKDRQWKDLSGLTTSTHPRSLRFQNKNQAGFSLVDGIVSIVITGCLIGSGIWILGMLPGHISALRVTQRDRTSFLQLTESCQRAAKSVHPGWWAAYPKIENNEFSLTVSVLNAPPKDLSEDGLNNDWDSQQEDLSENTSHSDQFIFSLTHDSNTPEIVWFDNGKIRRPFRFSKPIRWEPISAAQNLDQENLDQENINQDNFDEENFSLEENDINQDFTEEIDDPIGINLWFSEEVVAQIIFPCRPLSGLSDRKNSP